nr:sugar efflux transporter [Micromonospora sp. DSM 115978]
MSAATAVVESMSLASARTVRGMAGGVLSQTTPAAGPARRLGRTLLPLGLMFLASGISTALVSPFMALFLSTAVHAGPVLVTVFLVASRLAGVVAATLIGRISDRRPIRRAILVAASLAGLVSMALTAVVRDYWLLLALAVTGMAVATALFPQAFAYARQVLARDRPEQAVLGTSALRTVFSLAWVAGPPLGALLVSAGGFGYLYGAAAVLYLVAGLVAIFRLDRLDASAAPETADGDTPLEVPRWRLLVITAGFTILQTPLTLAVQVLPLFITTDLGGDVSAAGLILGLCAAVEIPLMLALGAVTSRIPVRVVVLVGGACGVAYYALMSVSSAVWQLAVAQVVNAAFIAAVAGVGISYLQDMLPRHPGRATTLFTNTVPIGAIMAAPLFGLAQQFGYRLAYVFATVLCAVGLLLLLLTRPDCRPPGRAGTVAGAHPVAERGRPSMPDGRPRSKG